MKLAKTLVLGVAGAIMISGSALAVDPPVPAATGPEVTIDIRKWVAVQFPDFEVGTQLYGTMEFAWPTGWGVELEIDGGSSFFDPLAFGGEVGYRVYRSFGDFEVGFGGGFGGGCQFQPLSCGGGISPPFVDLIYDYEDDRLTVLSENTYWFFVSDFRSHNEIEFQVSDSLLLYTYGSFYNFGDWWIELGAEYDITERFGVWAELEIYSGGFDRLDFGLEFAVTPALMLWAEVNTDTGGFDEVGFGVEYDASPLQLWAELWVDGGGFEFAEVTLEYEVSEWVDIFAIVGFDGDWWGGLGAMFEKPIGTGPYSLIARGSIRYSQCCDGLGFGAAIGVRYTVGDVDDEDDRPIFIFGP